MTRRGYIVALISSCLSRELLLLRLCGICENRSGDHEVLSFQIIDIEFLFPNYTLEIFNRYGNVLFKGDIHKPAWDGKNSNSSFINGEAPTGVYFYIIHYNKDNLPPKQGQLYLNR